MGVKAAFDSAARDCDRLRRQLIPCFDDFYRMAVGLLEFALTALLRILDIGAGTGLLAARIDAVRATGIDGGDLAAALARTRADVLAPLDLQLGWLRAAGFAEVDCAFKWRHFAVFSGRRPA